jgi:hypothetical protein
VHTRFTIYYDTENYPVDVVFLTSDGLDTCPEKLLIFGEIHSKKMYPNRSLTGIFHCIFECAQSRHNGYFYQNAESTGNA